LFKKILPYVLSVALAIIIFFAGVYAGMHCFAAIKSTTMLQDIFLSSVEINVTLEHLDKGETEKARQFLLLKQDGIILGFDNLSKYADASSYRTGCKIIKMIEQNRKNNPSLYASYSYGDNIEKVDVIKKEVAHVLEKWSTASCDKK
jgi:hypothetical protein